MYFQLLFHPFILLIYSSLQFYGALESNFSKISDLHIIKIFAFLNNIQNMYITQANMDLICRASVLHHSKHASACTYRNALTYFHIITRTHTLLLLLVSVGLDELPALDSKINNNPLMDAAVK